MPRQPKKKPELDLDLVPSSLHLLKRAQLQQYCKKLGLAGGGKNTDLVQRLQEHLNKPASSNQGQGKAATPEQKSPRTPPLPTPNDESQLKTPGGQGWCVVHGQQLTINQWFPLILRCGRVCLSSGDSYIPFHLTPSSKSPPPGLQDNIICSLCMERNQEKETRLRQGSILPDGPLKRGARTGSISVRHTSSTSQKRAKSGKFQPQEDPDYAKKVDDLLNQVAAGHVDLENVLQPIRPAVVHSPVGKPEHGFLPIDA